MPEHPIRERLADLHARKEQARNPGSERSVQRQHDRGKMLARERIDYLLDDGSFRELDMLARHRNPDIEQRPYTDGVITGWGTVDGRTVFVFSQDFTLFGGALGETFAEKTHKLMDMALKVGAPGGGPQRRRRRPHPGGPGQPGLLRRHLLPEREGVGRGAPDQRDHGPVRRRRGLQPGHDRLHLHGGGHVLHVHHRPRRREDGHRRGRHPAGARRRPDPQLQVGHRRLHRARRQGRARRRAVPAVVPAHQQPRDRAPTSRPAIPTTAPPPS